MKPIIDRTNKTWLHKHRAAILKLRAEGKTLSQIADSLKPAAAKLKKKIDKDIISVYLRRWPPEITESFSGTDSVPEPITTEKKIASSRPRQQAADVAFSSVVKKEPSGENPFGSLNSLGYTQPIAQSENEKI